MVREILLFIKANNSTIHRLFNKICRGEQLEARRIVELATEMASMETHKST